MSPPAPSSDNTRAAAGRFEDVGAVARREAAIARAHRRLRIVTGLGDLAVTLAEAVHGRAVAEEAAAKAALAVGEAAKAEPKEQPPA